MPEVESLREESEKAVHVKVRDFEIFVDHPKEQHGTDKGPTPSELLLTSLVGCFTGTLFVVARAMAIPVTSVSIKASAVKGERDYESLRSIKLEVKVTPYIESDDRFTRLMEQTKRNCTISNTLTHPPEISITRGKSARSNNP